MFFPAWHIYQWHKVFIIWICSHRSRAIPWVTDKDKSFWKHLSICSIACQQDYPTGSKSGGLIENLSFLYLMYPYLKIISLLLHSPLIPCFQVLFKNLLNLITIVFANHSLFYLKTFLIRGKNDSLGILTIHLLRLAYIQSYIYSLGDSHWAKRVRTQKCCVQLLTLFAIIMMLSLSFFTCIFSSFLPSSSFTFHCLINLLSSYHPPHLKNLCSLLVDSINWFYQAFLSSLSWKLQADDRKDHLMRSLCFLGNPRRKALLFVPEPKAHLRPFQKMFLPLFAFYVFYLIFLETGAFYRPFCIFPQSARQLYSKTFLSLF